MYYLTGNVTLTSGQALGNDVTLCVNGHSVTGNVTVTGGSFTLTDCGSGSLTGDVTVNEGGSFTLEDCALSGKIENSGTLTVTGGTVTAADGIGVENKGTFTMNSGTITAAGTGVVNNGTLTMNGGAVTGCGKGVENSGTMDVSGDVRIAGNTNGNLLLPEGITVTVGTLDSTANIGITAEKQSELTAGGSIRLTSGGAAYTTRFFADDAAAYAIFADGEDLVMRTLGEHTHCICGHPADGAGDIGDHTTHADVTFQPWTSGNSLPTTGNYYLTQNVVLNGMAVLTGTLCLNGYTISAKDGGCPVEVSSAVLNLTDCAAQPGSVTAAKDQAIDVYSAANIFNGVIRGGSGSGIYIGPYAANGNVTIYGGKITGSGTGAAANNGTMHMYGGEISGNSRGVQAGGTKGNGSFNGSFYLHGGKITGNTSVGEGGGVYADARSGNWRTKSVVMVQGSAQITGNKKGEEDNNLYLPGPSEGVIIHGDLDENADIRVTTETKPSEGSEMTIAKRGGLGAPEKVTVPDGAFKVDGADGTIRIGKDGSTVKLVPHTHIWTYALKSGTTDTITAVCSGCNASGGSVTIKAPAELTYSGGDKEATLDDQLTTGVTVSASDIGYRMGASLTGELLAGSYPRNAGTYTASITLGEGTGAVTASVRYAITPATITVTPNANQSKTYGADEPELTYDVSGAVNNETPAFEGALAREPGADAGEYTINLGTLKLVDGENFRSNNYDLKLADTEVKFTIAKNTATPGVTLSGDMVYKKQQIQPTVTVKIGNTILEKDKDYTVTYGENKNAGKSAGTVTIAAKGNYDFTRVVKMFDITAQIIQVAAVNKSSRVGQDIVELTYTHTEGLPYEGDTFTGALETTADKDKAGTYGITKGTLTLGSNYNIVFTPGTYTVEDKLPQDSFAFKDVVDGKVTKTYGDADFTIAVTGAATGSTVTYASTDMSVVTVDAETGKVHIMSAGTTTIKATAHETKDYTEKEISYTLTVAPKTMTKDDLTYSGPITKVYDGSNSAPSDLTVFVKPTSLVGSDTLTITGSAKYNSKDVKDADTITFTPDAITTGNYRLAAAEVLTITGASITKATPTYKKPTGVTAKYGQTLGDIALANPEGTTPGTWSWQTPQTVLDKIGSYTYDANFKPDDPNYKGVVGAAITVTVGKADGSNLKTVELTQKYTDASEHTYTPDWSGLPNGQTWSYGCESSSTLLTKNDVSAESGKLTYAISGGKAGDIVTITLKASCNNYEDFTITLNITLTEKDDQAALKLTGGTTVVYGQTLQLGTSGGSGTGAVTYTITDVDGQATIDADGKLTPVKVGTVKVKATKAEDANYNAITSAEVEITITKATPTGEPKYTEITTSGKTLADAALTLDGSTLKPNTGTLEWVDDKGNARPGDTKVEANTSYKWRFTPADANYTTLTGSIELYHKSSSGGGGWYYTYHTIKATAGANGSISPSGWTSVREGWDQTFTITPDKGYAVAKVLVDGKSVGAVKSYTFKNVTKDHTIEAIFMKSNGNPQTGVFVDVAKGSYYEEAIDWAVEKGITNGVSSNMFAPNDPCTRAQIVTFLWRAAGSPAPKSMSSFTDVPADAFYAKAVAWAVENGITSGTGESKFSPDATCTRAQAVTFLYRASGSPAVSGKAEFSDVSTTAFYADAVAWAAKKGITTGIGGGLFGSDNDCTRGQIVTFLWRAMAE